MAAATVDVKLRFDLRPLNRALASVRHGLGTYAIAVVASRLTERQKAQREYELGKEIAADHPGYWEVFCVTTDEGRCRVISRPRGGWA
ncbi:MAG TPA: hypothetical protein VFX35_01445 [Solirubrobacterales bacterium]|nr:hypothetical protein [Solirubrobacterales bacterium]